MTFLDWVSPQRIFWWIDLSTSRNATKVPVLDRREGGRMTQTVAGGSQVTVEKKGKKKKQFDILKLNEARRAVWNYVRWYIVVLKHPCTKTRHLRIPARSNGIISQSQAEHCLSHSPGAPLTRGIKRNLKASLWQKEQKIPALFMDLLNLSIYQRLMLSRQLRVSLGPLSCWNSHSLIMGKEKIIFNGGKDTDAACIGDFVLLLSCGSQIVKKFVVSINSLSDFFLLAVLQMPDNVFFLSFFLSSHLSKWKWKWQKFPPMSDSTSQYEAKPR